MLIKKIDSVKTKLKHKKLEDNLNTTNVNCEINCANVKVKEDTYDQKIINDESKKNDLEDFQTPHRAKSIENRIKYNDIQFKKTGDDIETCIKDLEDKIKAYKNEQLNEEEKKEKEELYDTQKLFKKRRNYFLLIFYSKKNSIILSIIQKLQSTYV